MKYWFYDIVRALLQLFFRLGYGLEVRGLEHVPKAGPFLLASNHLSYLDPPLLGAACPRRLGFMARDTLFRQWLLGAFMRGVHVIPLQRGEGDLGAIRESVRRLHQGEAVAIFPEGGRQLSGVLGRARRGVGLIAVAAQVPIVPVLVQGTFQALPPDSRRLRPAKIRVAFGPKISYTRAPLPPSRARHEQLAEAVTQAWRRLELQPGPRAQTPPRADVGTTPDEQQP